MPKIISFSFVKRSVKLALLVLILMLGWLLVSVLRILKGGEWLNSKKAEVEKGNILGVNPARADGPAVGGGTGGGGTSTPFFAAWNGKQFKIENDFLFGKPRGSFSDFREGKRNYEAGWISPDLYKIQNKFKLKGGAPVFQIQEIEPEESFINGMSLIRVAHPAGSEVMVGSDYRKFYVLDRKSLNQNFIKPSSILDKKGEDLSYVSGKDNLFSAPAKELSLSQGDSIDISFSNLSVKSNYFLIIKSYFRDWVMGNNPSLLVQADFFARSLAKSQILQKAALASLLIFTPSFLNKDGLLLPFIALGGAGSASGSTAGCCFLISFKDSLGQYRRFDAFEPRAWQYSAEMTTVPQETFVNSGNLHLKILARKQHSLGFIGLARNPRELPYQMETLGVKHAFHNRLQKDVTQLLQYRSGHYLHIIPGDTVDVEFEKPKLNTEQNAQETFLLRSAGFYTYLSPESKKTAGDWKQNLSEEAKERLTLINAASDRPQTTKNASYE